MRPLRASAPLRQVAYGMNVERWNDSRNRSDLLWRRCRYFVYVFRRISNGLGTGDFLIAGPPPCHSYIIELKHSAADASDAEIAKKHEEALEQLKKYSADPNLAALAAGTPVHFICYEFKGRELVRLEEVEPR